MKTITLRTGPQIQRTSRFGEGPHGPVARPKKIRKRNWRDYFKSSRSFKLDKNHPKPTVFVAMSGGVDSSVAAYLLKEEGYQLVGVFMKNWSFPEIPLKHCQLFKDYKDMVKVCKFLKIPYLVFNFEKEYKKRVMERFFKEYRTDRTPNPDVLCNTEIKFDLFLKEAIKQGADLMATGHHIRCRCANDQLSITNDQCKTYHLLKGKDPVKDQTYFVYNLTQKQLSKCLFPIGEYSKDQVRDIAHKLKLPTAYKRDSQGICFIGNINVKSFLKTRIAEQEGDIVDMQGKVLGQHEGAWFYTIGQRRIDGLAGTNKPLYVIDTDVKKNLVIVGPDKATYRKGVILEKFRLIDPGYFNRHPELTNCHPERSVAKSKDLIKQIPRQARNDKREDGNNSFGSLTAKPRYGPEVYPGKLEKRGKIWRFVFSKPQRALTPGQSLVIYDKDVCLGGGVIKKIIN